MDRLIREANPPTGQLASPKPQYKKPGVDGYEPVEGQHGAPFAILKDANGNVISPATDAKLEQVKSELELVKSELQTIKTNQTSGDQKVQLSGTVPPLVRVFERSYSGESGEQVDIFWSEPVKTGSSGNMKPLTVADYSKGFIEYRNNTNRTRRLFIYQFSSDESSGSMSGAVYANQAILHKSINVPAGTMIRLGSTVTVQQGEGLLEPEQLLNFYGVGFVIRTIWLSVGDVVNGTEKITFIARV